MLKCPDQNAEPTAHLASWAWGVCLWLFTALVASQLFLGKKLFCCHLEVDLKSSEITGKFWIWFSFSLMSVTESNMMGYQRVRQTQHLPTGCLCSLSPRPPVLKVQGTAAKPLQSDMGCSLERWLAQHNTLRIIFKKITDEKKCSF